MVRRRVAAGVAVVLLILIVLLVNACKKGQEQQSLKDYNRNVSRLAQESDTQVARPLFTALAGPVASRRSTSRCRSTSCASRRRTSTRAPKG